MPRDDNPRFSTRINGGGRCLATGPVEAWALAQPMVIDRAYVDQLPVHDFTVDRIATAYRDRGRLLAVLRSRGSNRAVAVFGCRDMSVNC